MSDTKVLLPNQWREAAGLSMAAMARNLDIGGKNPSRTYQRYESGEQNCPLEIVAKVEKLTGGNVTFASWLKVKREWIAAHPKAAAEKIAA